MLIGMRRKRLSEHPGSVILLPFFQFHFLFGVQETRTATRSSRDPETAVIHF